MTSPNSSQKLFAFLPPGGRIWVWAALVLLLAPPPGPARAAELTDGGRAIVQEVVDGDTVVLAEEIGGARQVRLVGIQAPKLPLNRPNFAKWPLADQSKAALEALVGGKAVRLKFGGRKMDRHGRHLAHLYLEDGRWVQGALLADGMARVYSFADNRALVAELLAAEQAARAAGRGIWRHPYYRIRTAEEERLELSSFQLVEGRVIDVARVNGRAFLNFGANWRTDFTAALAPPVLRAFDLEGYPLDGLEGRKIRVRGWLKSRNGPMIDITHPEQIEVFDE